MRRIEATLGLPRVDPLPAAVVDMLAAFLLPDVAKVISGYITIPSAIAEVSMVVYLLVIGAKIPKADKRISAAASPIYS